MRYSLFCIPLILSSCAKDRTSDDYRREMLQKELTKIQSVVGTYSGELHSKDGGPSLGWMKAELESDTQVKPSPDGTKSEQFPVLKMKVTFYGARPLSAVFEQTSFQSETRTITAMHSTKSPTNETGIKIQAVEKDSLLSGSIQISNLIGTERTFELRRDDPGIPPNAIPGSEAGGNFKAVFRDSRVRPPFTTGTDLILMSHIQTPEEEFVEFLSMIKPLQVIVSMDPRMQIALDNALWDKKQGTLAARRSNVGYDLSLDCRVRTSPEGGWSCRYSSSLNGTSQEFEFLPVAN